MKTGKIEEIRIEEIEEMETDTMSKLEKVFDTPNKKAFIGFLTAGDPDADSTDTIHPGDGEKQERIS